MSIQLSRNLKVFLTTNLSSAGAVLDTGFTSDNTRQLIVVEESFDFAQEKSYDYITTHNQIDPVSQLEIRSNPTLEVGSLTFATTMNTGTGGPFDARMWNATVSGLRYPLGVWTISNDSQILKLTRQTQGTVAVGIIAFVDGVAYVFDSVRVSDLAISLTQEDVTTNNWSCAFEKYRAVPAVCSISGAAATFAGSLTGTAIAETDTNYTWAAGKLARVTVTKPGGLDPVQLAAIEIELAVQNSQSYIEDLGIDRTALGVNYTDAGPAVIEGGLIAYSRGPGSAIYTLVQEIRSHMGDPYSTSLYEIKIEVFGDAQSKLCDIQLYNCSLQSITSISDTLIDTFNFKVVDGVQAQNCFIKFYT